MTNALKKRPQPTLISVGNKQVTSHGRWNDDLITSFVLTHGYSRWIEIKELARVAYHGGQPSNQDRVRGKMHRLFKTALSRNVMLVIEYDGPHNSATAVKVLDKDSEPEVALALARLEKWKARKLVTAEQYDCALAILNGTPEAGDDEDDSEVEET
jgi:hypothetical protein